MKFLCIFDILVRICIYGSGDPYFRFTDPDPVSQFITVPPDLEHCTVLRNFTIS